MNCQNNYKFAIIENDIIYLLENIKDIQLHFNKTVYEILARTRDEEGYKMYVIENQQSKNNNIEYLVVMNDFSYFNICKSIRSAAKTINVDFSCLAKQLKNSKYKSVGGGNPGRKKKNSNNILEGFSIFKITKFDFGKYYPKLNLEDIIEIY